MQRLVDIITCNKGTLLSLRSSCVVFLFQVVWQMLSGWAEGLQRTQSFKVKGRFLSRGKSRKFQVCLVGSRHSSCQPLFTV